MHFLDELQHARLKSHETFLAEWMVDAVVDSVACHNHIGCGFLQHTIEAFVDVRPWKRMAGLGQSGTTLTRQAEVQQFRQWADAFLPEPSFNHRNVAAVVGDGIPQKNDPLCGSDKLW